MVRVQLCRAAALLALSGLAAAQEGPVLVPHVPYVATSPSVAEAMLEIAKVQPSDVVYDLGCGDGRIVILAARKFGARGVGIDIDPDRIKEANENARRAGVSDKVRFLQADLFFADIREATVVAMFLLPTINVKLRPKLFRQLHPGARIVTHSFDIGDWAPERRTAIDGVPIYVWTIPETTVATGQVLMEDGTPPPLAASIERTCGQRVTFEGYTDAKGRFAIALPLSERDTTGCRVRAVLAGYRSGTSALGPRLEIIRLERSGTSEGTLVSAASLAAPPLAKEAFEKGREALEQANRDDAEKNFTQAAAIYPQYSTAWFELGALYESRGDAGNARAAYQKAVAADPKYISPYLGLGQLAVHANQWREVTGYMESVLRLDPESFPDAWMYHAVGCLTLQRFDAAEKSARETMRLDVANQFPRAEYVLALVLAWKGDLAGAKAHLAHYIEADPKAPDLTAIKRQLADMKSK